MGAAGFHMIPGVLQIVHSQNTGAAFGMFTEFKYRMGVFYVFTGFAVWVLWGLYSELKPDDRLGAWIVGLIAAGAVGNLIDRIHKQSVTDFVRVHWGPDSWLTGIMGSPEWPSFNVADMAIVGGVGLFVIQYLFFEDRQGDDEAADDESTAPSEA
jgi:signal peptidase II